MLAYTTIRFGSIAFIILCSLLSTCSLFITNYIFTNSYYIGATTKHLFDIFLS